MAINLVKKLSQEMTLQEAETGFQFASHERVRMKSLVTQIGNTLQQKQEFEAKIEQSTETQHRLQKQLKSLNQFQIDAELRDHFRASIRSARKQQTLDEKIASVELQLHQAHAEQEELSQQLWLEIDVPEDLDNLKLPTRKKLEQFSAKVRST